MLNRTTGFALTAVALVSGLGASANAFAQTAKDVNVVNVPSVQVTNEPGVHVTNVPSVKVVSLPAVQVAPGLQVGIDPQHGTVTVGNSASNPVPVIAVGSPVREPVEINVECRQAGGAATCQSTVYQVPSNQRLVIQHVTLNSKIADKGIGAYAQFDVQVAGSYYTYRLGLDEHAFAYGSIYSANSPALFYAGPGTPVQVFVEYGGSYGTGIASATFLMGLISGYLEAI